MLERRKRLLLPTQIGTIKAGISMEIEGGWKVLNKEEVAGEYLVTVELVSVASCNYTEEVHEQLHEELIGHTHRTVISTTLLTFDHDPTTEDVGTAVDETGFCPILADVDIVVIKTITEGEEDVLEYNAKLQPTEFAALFDMLPISVEVIPTSMSLKGDWLHLYYASAKHEPPTQFFIDSFFLYSVRIHKNTGEIRRKGYNKGLTLASEVTSTLVGFEEIENILATGTYLDEPRVTIYHMKSSDEKDYVTNVATVEIPYYGTTFENGVVIRTREYTREMNTV